MFKSVVRLILKRRLINLTVILLVTAFMLYKAFDVRLSYDMAQMLPPTDSTYIEYQKFKKLFGEDGTVFFVGIQDKKIYKLKEFNDWYDLTNKLENIKGVQEVISVARMYHLVKNTKTHKFDFKPIILNKPKTQHELDSLKDIILSFPVYDGLLYNKSTNASMMAITLDKNVLNTKKRVGLVMDIKNTIEEFGNKHDIDVHYSGLPYIRTVTTKKTEEELKLFILLAILISATALFFFFKSFRATLIPIIIVCISVVWAFGTISIFGYKITMLTGIIPPLLIIIGIENCIFLLNKYHNEYKIYNNKIKALARTIQKMFGPLLLTNITTGVGFATFIITRNSILAEFGVIASLNILFIFFLTMFLMPILFSYTKAPKLQQIKYLDNKIIKKIISKIEFLIINRRNLIYVITVSLFILGIIGITKLKTTGKIVDDISKKDVLYTDMMFFEKNIKGIMPFEISIDTKKKNGVMRLSFIRKLDKLEKVISLYPEMSKSLSIVDVVKSAKQAFFNGKSYMYSLPNNQEKNFIFSYLPKMEKNKKTIFSSFVDTNMQVTRITTQMANIGTRDIQRIKDNIKPKIDSIFSPEKYDVTLTGTSVVFLKGTDFLVKNLTTSLIFALIVISILMSFLFTSLKMTLISLIPNLFPQLLTAALMGYLCISIKPSTILIFSVALGISVDNSIHFLSKYRQELKFNNWNIKNSVIYSLREINVTMIYSSVILISGFSIFAFSGFGGIQAMGFLISFTLFIALLSNLFLLPSLLLTLDKKITTKAFKEPLLEIFDEEEDIELDELELE